MQFVSMHRHYLSLCVKRHVFFDKVKKMFLFSLYLPIVINTHITFCSQDPVWKNYRKRFHIEHVLHQLLDTFASSPSVVPAFER